MQVDVVENKFLRGVPPPPELIGTEGAPAVPVAAEVSDAI